MANIYKDALDVQDACNLRAIARLLVRAADQAADRGGTDASYRDAAVVLIVNKIDSLVWSSEHFSQAYDECERRQCCDYHSSGGDIANSCGGDNG